jgi:bifunctional non-homologous end joining protein LigD
VTPYAVRARSGAPVATPLDWNEVHDSYLKSTSYTISNIFRRLGQKADPWAGIGGNAGSIAAGRKRFERVLSQDA